MSSDTSFWKRLGNILRADGRNRNGNSGVQCVTPTESVSGNGRERIDADSRSSLLPWVRRKKAIERLDERYQRMLELIDAMRGHFEAQDCRAAEVTAGLERVGGTLDRLADTQQAQCDGIASIVARVDDAARSSTGLTTMLAEMPASLQAQAEAVHAVARQMEATRAADAQLTGSLQRFGQAADSLGKSGAAQVESLQRLHETSADQKESLQVFVHQQTRLLLIITVSVAVLGLGAIGALAAVVHMLFRGSVPNVT
jgi:chromosome segregation ATPase